MQSKMQMKHSDQNQMKQDDQTTDSKDKKEPTVNKLPLENLKKATEEEKKNNAGSSITMTKKAQSQPLESRPERK